MSTPKFNKDQSVKFFRNEKEKLDSVKIAVVVPSPVSAEYLKSIKKENVFEQQYIIEHPYGNSPNSLLQQKFELDFKKKYLSVNEDELTLG